MPDTPSTHSSPRWGAGGNPEQGEWTRDASTHSTRFPALDRPLFDSIFVRDALDGTDGLPPEEGWWHIVHRDEMASLVEQFDVAVEALRETTAKLQDARLFIVAVEDNEPALAHSLASGEWREFMQEVYDAIIVGEEFLASFPASMSEAREDGDDA